jgi:hypothetical protein
MIEDAGGVGSATLSLQLNNIDYSPASGSAFG